MRRLRRIMWNVATVVSLLLCVATVVLWVRSYRHTDEAYRTVRAFVVVPIPLNKTVETSNWWVASAGGGVTVYRLYYPPGIYFDGPNENVTESRRGVVVDEGSGRQEAENAGLVLAEGTQMLGFAWTRDPSGSRTLWAVRVPDWALLALAGGLPANRILARARRLRRRRRGACLRCGYDLRATPDRCPECSAVPTPPA